MKMVAVHTAPLWQEDDGSRTVGLGPRNPAPSVVGWCNAGLIRLDGELRWFLLAHGPTA